MRTSGLCFLFALPLSLAAPALEDLAGNTEVCSQTSGHSSASPLLLPYPASTVTESSQNGLAAGSPCKGHTVIFGRGTFEIGNVGSITGPPFFEALSKLVNSDLAVQGVDYPANIRGFLAGGDTDGSAKMAQLVEQALTTCPYTKISLSGYRYGLFIAHVAPDMRAHIRLARELN